MAKNKEMTARQEAGLVESDFEKNPRDEVVEAGEHLSDESEESGEVILSSPSALASPYMSAEEQGLPMSTEIVGPPAYGSPEPATSAGKLLSLRDHPLRSDAMPEGHPAAIAEDYGADHTGDYVMPGESSHPVIPLADSAAAGNSSSMEEVTYDEATKAELFDEAERRGLDVNKSMNKSELIDALEASDAEAGNGGSGE